MLCRSEIAHSHATLFSLILQRATSTSLFLVLSCGSLACLELVKIPAADLHVALILIHAAREVAGVSVASATIL